jgi:hypothetical protein
LGSPNVPQALVQTRVSVCLLTFIDQEHREASAVKALSEEKESCVSAVPREQGNQEVERRILSLIKQQILPYFRCS